MGVNVVREVSRTSGSRESVSGLAFPPAAWNVEGGPAARVGDRGFVHPHGLVVRVCCSGFGDGGGGLEAD